MPSLEQVGGDLVAGQLRREAGLNAAAQQVPQQQRWPAALRRRGPVPGLAAAAMLTAPELIASLTGNADVTEQLT
jgi:hypothetical protein